jgi:preprotein translocase subunit SecD
MVIYYKWAGFIADTALILNLILLVAIMSYFSATLTVPGIAGVILSLAMAIDANVLIIERMREEKLMGKPIATIIQLGYEKAWSAIFDSNITTIIAAMVLFFLGTGTIRGFAITLGLGTLLSMLTAITLTRYMLKLMIDSKISTNANAYGANGYMLMDKRPGQKEDTANA